MVSEQIFSYSFSTNSSYHLLLQCCLYFCDAFYRLFQYFSVIFWCFFDDYLVNFGNLLIFVYIFQIFFSFNRSHIDFYANCSCCLAVSSTCFSKLFFLSEIFCQTLQWQLVLHLFIKLFMRLIELMQHQMPIFTLLVWNLVILFIFIPRIIEGKFQSKRRLLVRILINKKTQ